MCKLLACDLDGTLFYPKHLTRCISKRNVWFLRRWIDAGNKLVLITSRTAEFVERLKKEIKRPFDYMACTSAQVFHDDKLIKHVWMPNDELKDVFWKIDKKYKPIAYLLSGENHPCVCYNPKRVPFFFVVFYNI